LVVALLALAWPCQQTDAQENAKPGVFESPRAVFKAFKQVAKKHDLAGILRCANDDGVEDLAARSTFGITFDAGMGRIAANGNETAIKAAEARCKKVGEFLIKHGLTGEATDKAALQTLARNIKYKDDNERVLAYYLKLMESIKDKPSYLAELMALMQHPSAISDVCSSFSKGFEYVTLGDVKIKGKKAQATFRLLGDDKGRWETLEFRKIKGNWKIVLIPDPNDPTQRTPSAFPPAPPPNDYWQTPPSPALTPNPGAASSCVPGCTPHTSRG
jgi:hypothetical protein